MYAAGRTSYAVVENENERPYTAEHVRVFPDNREGCSWRIHVGSSRVTRAPRPPSPVPRTMAR